MMTFLANIGSSTANIFKFIYLKINAIKRNFRFRKFKSDSIYRTEIFENEFIDNQESSFQNEKTCNQNSFKEETNELKKTSTMKLSFKLEHTESNVDLNVEKKESKLKQSESKETNLSQMNILDSKKNRDVKFTCDSPKEENTVNLSTYLKLTEGKDENILDAAKRIDNLIDSNLDDEIFLDQLEFCCLDEKIEESDEEIDFRTNKSLLPNIFKYKILVQAKKF